MKAPAFQFYAADYLADEAVQLMSLEEEGAYIRMLAICWREGSIPDDDDKLSRLCKGASATVLRVVKGCFKRSEENASRLVHPRLEKERENQRVWREKSAEGGRKSAEARAANRLNSNKKNPNAKGGSRVVQPACLNTSSSSSSSNSSYSSNTHTERVPDVLSIVQTYPRRERQSECIQIVAKHIEDGEDPLMILSGTKAIAEVIRGMPSGASNRYLPAAHSFFVGKRWQDDPETWRREPPKEAKPHRQGEFAEPEMQLPDLPDIP